MVVLALGKHTTIPAPEEKPENALFNLPTCIFPLELAPKRCHLCAMQRNVCFRSAVHQTAMATCQLVQLRFLLQLGHQTPFQRCFVCGILEQCRQSILAGITGNWVQGIHQQLVVVQWEWRGFGECRILPDEWVQRWGGHFG